MLQATTDAEDIDIELGEFQWAPTLGGECYANPKKSTSTHSSFNGHPPLGVNATVLLLFACENIPHGFNGHPPLGVNAT